MTNESKAAELSNKWGVRNCDCGDNSTYECYDAALEMAEWKDQQFKEYLERKREEIVSARGRCPDDFEQGINHGEELAMKQIINELFGE